MIYYHYLRSWNTWINFYGTLGKCRMFAHYYSTVLVVVTKFILNLLRELIACGVWEHHIGKSYLRWYSGYFMVTTPLFLGNAKTWTWLSYSKFLEIHHELLTSDTFPYKRLRSSKLSPTLIQGPSRFLLYTVFYIFVYLICKKNRYIYF